MHSPPPPDRPDAPGATEPAGAPEDPRYAPPTRQRVPYKPGTLALSVVLGAIFLLEVAAAHGSVMSIPAPLLSRLGGNAPMITREAHEYWRLLTAAYLHGGLIHVGMNVYALLIIGSAIELTLGAGWMMTGFVASGITGSIVSAIGNKPNVVAIGASGGIFGLIGMAAALTWLAPRETGFNRAALVQWIGFGLAIGFVGGFDNWGHVGGILGGGIAAFAVAALRKDRRRLLRVGRVLGIVSVIVSAAAIGRAALAYQHPALAYDDAYDEDRNQLIDALRKNDVAGAVRIGRQIAVLHPEDPLPQFVVATADAEAGDCEAAVPRFRRLLESLGPRGPEPIRAFIESNRLRIHLGLAGCLEKLGKGDESRAERAAFCALAPTAPDRDELARVIESLCEPGHDP